MHSFARAGSIALLLFLILDTYSASLPPCFAQESRLSRAAGLLQRFAAYMNACEPAQYVHGGTATPSALMTPAYITGSPGSYAPQAAPGQMWDKPVTTVRLPAPSSDHNRQEHLLTTLELGKLTRYDIAILIDCSGSMLTRDCRLRSNSSLMPFGWPQEISRFDWCRDETVSLAQQTSGLLRQGITLVPFSARTRRYTGAGPEDIERIFRSSIPWGATNLAEALKGELDRYFQDKDSGVSRAPLMIAVITDGLPSNRRAVANLIKEAASRINSPDDIHITFLQVGQDCTGTNFLREMDDRLVAQGARWDIVSTWLAGELNAIGLPRALVQSVSYRQQ